jgi:uncharacterized protein (TIGR00369 family)
MVTKHSFRTGFGRAGNQLHMGGSMSFEDRESSAPTIDAEKFFHDEEFRKRYPGVKVPPPCFVVSGAKITDHEANRSLTVEFPVSDSQTNPLGHLQGGILGSYFDNVFGPLSFATMRKPCVSVDLTLNFVRPANPGEVVTIRAEFKSKSRKLVQLYAEAHNEKRKLIATATSNLMVYEP